ncbi:glycosyltransferase family 4 protein [Methanothrix thermoacetophila]|uniref:Glycosyl transferase, group 1 n=2 Tax=Methanothrix TaxID=2222 RepID=A0B9E8_METTP|nr:glycosyltransferase family 4 protein [Methanothrix thermoacetophila]ABK15322.1 glycosyl transferase, group 1 [Methanothrix thermoacetophila PT]
MNIAYLSTEYPPLVYGGLGVYVDLMSRELASMGHKVSVFTMGRPDLKRKRRETKKGVTAFREIPIPMSDALEIFYSKETLSWGTGLDFLNNLLSYNQLAAARVRDSGPFDLCVAHDWLALPAGMALRQSMPVIYHVHCTEVGRSEHPNQQLVSLEIKGARLADLVLTVSEAMKRELEGLGVPPKKIRVCYHGVDTKLFDPSAVKPERLEMLRKSYGLKESDTVLLFLGRLEPVKGVSQLLAALPAIRRNNPDVKLLVVGSGSLIDHVRSEAERLGGVILVDRFLSPQEKVYHYALADLCIFPSTYEPFGIVALEAASMERVSVVGASGVSGLREIVMNPETDRPTGVHVNARDPNDIAWGVNLALEDRDRLREWGRNARERVLEMFTWRKAAENTLKIYEEVIAYRS